eukprot:494123_1
MSEFYTDFIPHNCSIPATEMVHRMQNGIKTFKEIINENSNNKQLLLSPANWMIIIDYIYQNCSFSQHQHQHQGQLNLLDQLKQLAANSKLNDDKYRIIKQQDLLATVKQAPGFEEFVEALGFKGGIYDNRLMMTEMDQSKINTAIFVIENKIKQIHNYEALCKLWQTALRIMLDHKVFKTQTILTKLIKLDFVVNYNDYYDILKKLIAISNVKIYSEDGLIVEMMTNLGFTITHLGNDIQSQKVFTYMKLIYNKFKTIESSKKKLKSNDYYKCKTDFYDSKENKYDDNDENRKYCLTVTEVENRRKTGIKHFEEILNSTSSDKEMYLLNPLNWDILLDGICSNMKPSEDKAKRLEKLKNMTQKAWHGDKYREINLNTKGAKRNIVNIHGALVFLRGVGFKGNILKNSIVFGNDSTFITDVAINAIIYKIKMVKKTHILQSTWAGTLQIMLKHPSFTADTDRDKLATLCSMNLHLNYENYHEILTKVLKVKQQQNEKTSSLEFLKELGLDIGMGFIIDEELSKKLFRFLRSIYTQIDGIELDKRNHVQQMNNLVPSMERIVTMPQALQTPGFDLDRRPTLTSAEIMDNIFAFGRNWNDKIDKMHQLLDDNELAKLYEMDDMKNLENEMLTKVFELQNEMQASSFQMEEYLQYIHHFKATKEQKNSLDCEDSKCEWDKETVQLWSLDQRQIVHIMFYHTKDYNEIAKCRADRFRYDVHRYYERQRKKPETDISETQLLGNETKGEIYVGNVDEKQPEPGGTVCANGDDCSLLTKLLNRCANVNDHKESINNMNECKDEMDHCLECHGNFRNKCLYKSRCDFQKLKDTNNNNRFIQLHGHFYHDIAIDVDEDIIKMNPKLMDNEESIQYKFGSEQNIENQSFGILEFGNPFTVLKKTSSKFKNPKEEILRNSYHHIQKGEWNELLRKCVLFAKSMNAKMNGLNVKMIVALKLYTDFDDLQRQFRMCFRENDETERKKRQAQFYY